MNKIFTEGDRVIVPGNRTGTVKGFTVYEDNSLLYHVQLDDGSGCFNFTSSLMELITLEADYE